jgi:DNA-damage-inducible protein J
MATQMVHIRVDEKVKTKAAKALTAMGLTVSDAVRMMLTRVASEQAMPFDVHVPNAKTIAAMREARAGNLESFNSVEALMADLNA